MASSPEEIRKHTRLYLIIGALLFGCTVLTVTAAQYNFGSQAIDVSVGLLIAAFKSVLVGLVFMHLSNEKKMIYLFLVIAGVFFIGLMFLSLWAKWNPIYPMLK